MSANAYEDFLRDIHPELLDQFRLFSEEKDIYKQFITFAHPEFKADFKKYTEKLPEYYNYKVARFYVNNPELRKLTYFRDVGIDNDTKQFILLDEAGKPISNERYDNIGILSYKRDWECPLFGVYVKKDDSYALLTTAPNDKELFRDPSYGRHLSKFEKYGLPHYKDVYQLFAGMTMQWFKDETIILDENTKLVPYFKPNSHKMTAFKLAIKATDKYWKARNIYYVGKLPEYCTQRDRLLMDFLNDWNTASPERKAVLRDGLGYNIGLD